MVYGAAVPALSDQITGFVNGQNSSVVTGTATISTTASSTSTVAGGPYTITITAGTLSAANYSSQPSINGSLTVNPAPLTVTANNVSMVYGARRADALRPDHRLRQRTEFQRRHRYGDHLDHRLLHQHCGRRPYTITITAGTLSAANYTFTTLTTVLSPSTRRR